MDIREDNFIEVEVDGEWVRISLLPHRYYEEEK